VIIHVARTGHALTVRADNGAEILLHLGLDTVELNGEGFSMLVKEGVRVTKGQPLLRYDLDKVGQLCKSLVSLLILTNSQDFQVRPITLKAVKVGEPLLHIVARNGSAASAEVVGGPEVQGHVLVAHRGGLHARPAALIRQTAQGFKSQSQLHFGGKSAPCNSLIGLMGLAVGEQDEVQSAVRGRMLKRRCKRCSRRWRLPCRMIITRRHRSVLPLLNARPRLACCTGFALRRDSSVGRCFA
jgi:phosphocarrier protein